MIKLSLDHALLKEEVTSYQAQVSEIHNHLVNKTGKGNDSFAD